MASIEEFENQLSALVGNLSSAQRKALTKEIGKRLAQSQRTRIRKQQNPDGTNYTPRKAQHRIKKRAKRKMFAKLATAKLMKTTTNDSQINIGYFGGDAVIADVHQYGKPSHVVKNANWKVDYDQRELLGFTEEDIETIESLIIEHLAK